MLVVNAEDVMKRCQRSDKIEICSRGESEQTECMSLHVRIYVREETPRANGRTDQLDPFGTLTHLISAKVSTGNGGSTIEARS